MENDGVNLERIWKEFGKSTEAGKLLYNIYGVNYKPQDHITYPKLLLKTPEMKEKERIEKEKAKHEKQNKISKASQKIDYSSGWRHYQKNVYNPYGRVDYIPHKRNEYQIQAEVTKMKKQMSQNFKTNLRIGKSREEQINRLQDNFEYQERMIMPKGARMPGLKITDDEMQNQKIQIHNNVVNKFSKKDDKRDEMENLYNNIVNEIDERYKYMNEMKALGKNVDNVIMAEIKERIDDMKTLQKMISNYDKKEK